MFKQLTDMPDGVLGFEASGKIEAADYKNVLAAPVEAALAKNEGVRLVFVLGPDFDGYSGGAAWEDMKFGAHHLTGWNRLALVSDHEWVNHLAGLFGWMVPGKFKHFPLAEKDKAIAWAAADD